MTDIERIERRLSAVERAVVDSDHELDELTNLAALAEDIESMQQRLTNLERRVAEIEGSLGVRAFGTLDCDDPGDLRTPPTPGGDGPGTGAAVAAPTSPDVAVASRGATV